MPVRKPEPASQFDLFSASPEPPKRPVPAAPPPEPANDRQVPPARPKSAPVPNPLPPAANEWWTTRMTCEFLKISRKTLWERRRDPALEFPQPVQLGGAHNLYRAAAVKAWADAIAAAQQDAGIDISSRG